MEQLPWEKAEALDRRRLKRNITMVYKVKWEKTRGMQNFLFVEFVWFYLGFFHPKHTIQERQDGG